MIEKEDITALCTLDASGWLAGDTESASDYVVRVAKARDSFKLWQKRLAEGKTITFSPEITVSAEQQIPADELAAATAFTARHYAFTFNEGLGFYLSQGVALLWGGCAFFDAEKNCHFFMLRDVFRTQEKYLGLYTRGEIVTHELCHSVRQPLHDDDFEEYFAYQCSRSRLRRYLGNCFIRQRDAMLVLIPSLLMAAVRAGQIFAAVDIPLWPFSSALIGGCLWLLARNQRSRFYISRASANLCRAGITLPEAVLFRCTAAEIKQLSKLTVPETLHTYAAARAAENFRWRIITARFFTDPPTINS